MHKDKSSVYLLILKEKPFFKIGKANDSILRMLELEKIWGKFDLDKSIEIICEATKVHNLEKTLHNIFSDHHVKMDEKLNGYTEWFNISCFDGVVDMVKAIKFQNSSIDEIRQGISIPTNLTKAELYKERKKFIKKEEEEKKISKAIKENEIRAHSIVDFFKSKKNVVSYFNREIGLFMFDSEIISNKIVEDILLQGVFSYPNGFMSPFFLSYNRCSEGAKKEHRVCISKWRKFTQDAKQETETMVTSIEIIDNYFSIMEKDEDINSSQALGEKYLEKYQL